MSLSSIFKKNSIGRGIEVPHMKNTAESETIRMPAPSLVTIPMSQHIGAPCSPIVKIGDYVGVGQKIGDASAPFSAPVHASVSGTVKSIIDYNLANGRGCKAVVIESDGEEKLYEGITPPEINSKEDFLKAVRESGLVGLGGAGFPTHIKLNPPAHVNIDTLIINGAECEPYLTPDYRESMENSWDVMSGIYSVADLLDVDRVIIGIENNKPKAIKELSKIADSENDKGDKVKVHVLQASYPQGAEKVLIYSTTGRVVEAGKLPSDVGVVVMNITSIAFLARYMKTGIPLIRKRVTLDGSAVKNPCNIDVPIGTAIKDIVEFAGGLNEEAGKILFGGPMMGTAAVTDEASILKNTNGLLVFNRKDATLPETTGCIRCGNCVRNCPMHLMPVSVEKMLKVNDLEGLKDSGAMVCMECGCCSYVCPAKRPLVQSMRKAKNEIRKMAGGK